MKSISIDVWDEQEKSQLHRNASDAWSCLLCSTRTKCRKKIWHWWPSLVTRNRIAIAFIINAVNEGKSAMDEICLIGNIAIWFHFEFQFLIVCVLRKDYARNANRVIDTHDGKIECYWIHKMLWCNRKKCGLVRLMECDTIYRKERMILAATKIGLRESQRAGKHCGIKLIMRIVS